MASDEWTIANDAGRPAPGAQIGVYRIEVPLGEGGTFDITPDGTQIVFDRLRENSDIALIDR